MLIRCVNRPFLDREARAMRKVGDEWEATPERLRSINSAGYGIMAEIVPCAHETPQEASQAIDLGRLTVAELTRLCGDRGIAIVGRPRKAELVAMLEG